MKAIKILSAGKASITHVPKPTLPPAALLVKVVSAGLNPTDWKHIAWGDFDEKKTPPPTVGCDFSGVVEQVGDAVTRPFKVGDRVWGFVAGANKLQPDNGSFAEYLVANADVSHKIPDHMSFEDAATLGIQVYTTGQGLYQSLELPWPTKLVKPEEKFPVFVYGGSSAMGSLGIQMAKLSGAEVITVCSPQNFGFVKSLGADKVFDYKSPGVGAAIREYTNNNLHYTWDTIGTEQSAQICADALASSAPAGTTLRYTTFRTPELPRDDVKSAWTLAYTALNAEFPLLGKIHFPANPADLDFAKKWGPVASKLFEDKKVFPHPVEVITGLEAIEDGLKRLEEGKISGRKLVARISDP